LPAFKVQLMTSPYFGALVRSTAQPDVPVRQPSLCSRLADRLDFVCRHPLNHLIKAFSDGTRFHYSKDSSVPGIDAWKDTAGGRHWRLGRVELEVFEKHTPEARVVSALEHAGNRWCHGDAWEEMVALGIKDKVGAPARQLIYQCRWRDLDAWVVQRRAETVQRQGASEASSGLKVS
jgi:hypothetical protein